MKGKEFEQLCIDRMKSEEKRGRATMGRYGVQGTFIADKAFDIEPHVDRLLKAGNKSEVRIATQALVKAATDAAGGWQKMESLPDFEGIVAMRGQQFTFDAKVCGDATYGISKTTQAKSRQLDHLLRRSKFGGIGFLLIHFTPRELKGKTTEPETWAFPVHPDHPFWVGFAAGENTRITREQCAQYAVSVEWNMSKGSKTLRPDILDAVCRLAEGNYYSPASSAVAGPAKPF
jgi:penicillin-binding protein-related factor A (putative recombinase)